MLRFCLILSLLLCCRGAAAQPANANVIPAAELSGVLLVNDGDSLFYINGSVTRSTSLTFVSRYVGPALHAANTSIPGETLAQMVPNFGRNVGSKYSNQYRLFIVHSMGGGNDLREGTPAATVYALLQEYVAAVHALGPNARSIVSTVPIQCDFARNKRKNDLLKQFNDLVRSGWSRPREAGGLGADGLVDYFADPTIGDNTYSASAFCSRDWSPDGGHLNDSGKAIMAQAEIKAIRRLLARH